VSRLIRFLGVVVLLAVILLTGIPLALTVYGYWNGTFKPLDNKPIIMYLIPSPPPGESIAPQLWPGDLRA
jgi:hypothetical protein